MDFKAAVDDYGCKTLDGAESVVSYDSISSDSNYSRHPEEDLTPRRRHSWHEPPARRGTYERFYTNSNPYTFAASRSESNDDPLRTSSEELARIHSLLPNVRHVHALQEANRGRSPEPLCDSMRNEDLKHRLEAPRDSNDHLEKQKLVDAERLEGSLKARRKLQKGRHEDGDKKAKQRKKDAHGRKRDRFFQIMGTAR